ncbi:MAG TPA: hypothetical protein VFX59_02435 [Polyangiales bacterium]|nr:hypothetical protein [Polyangiales bacterium]
MPRKPLPKWVVSNEVSLEREAADYIHLTPSQRAVLVDVLCCDAQRLLAARPDRERALAYRDPLPASSVQLLARLRAEWRAKRAHGS